METKHFLGAPESVSASTSPGFTRVYIDIGHSDGLGHPSLQEFPGQKLIF